MIELEYAKDIVNDKYVHLDRVVSISKALISVTAILEEVTKQLTAEHDTVQKLVAENAELKNRTVKVPVKVYVKDMKSNVVRWAQVIDALSDAGIAFARDDGELIAGTRETPATDAAISEIKAQGVDELIADRKSEWMFSYCEDAAEFAANLRSGGKR